MYMKNKKIMAEKYNVLLVGCHPDDVELGCGGTILKHIERGDNVSVLVMTKGDNGNHHPELEECNNSMKVLGVKNVYFGDFKDGFSEEASDKFKNISIITYYTFKNLLD